MDLSALPPISSEQIPHSMSPVRGFRVDMLPVRPQFLLLGAFGGNDVGGVEVWGVARDV
jgi:hypothetical protein